MIEVISGLFVSMRESVGTSFPESQTCFIDRVHVQKLACDTMQELHIKRRWDAMQQTSSEMEEARLRSRPTFHIDMSMERQERSFSYVYGTYFLS